MYNIIIYIYIYIIIIIALKYYKLDPSKSELRDLVLAIRADECHHRDFHRLKSYLKEDLQQFSVTEGSS